MDLTPPQTHTIDLAALGAIVGTAAGWLPIAAAGAAFIWYVIQIVDRFRNGPSRKLPKARGHRRRY